MLLLSWPKGHRAHPRMCADESRTIRVCTFGGEGSCSKGDGEVTLRALRFLAPEDELTIDGCSCLARCDRGVAVRVGDDGTIEEELNDAKACARLLRRRYDFAVDPRLSDAFDSARRGAVHEEAGKLIDALNAYNRAFGLATAAGLGVKWRTRPSSVLRVQLGRSSQAARSESSRATRAQLAWLSSLMIARSRVFSLLSVQGWPRAQRRALEDAQYAVQLASVGAPPVAARPSAAADNSVGGAPVVLPELVSDAEADSASATAIETAAAAAAAAAVSDADADAAFATAVVDAVGTPAATAGRAAAWERLAEVCEAMRDIEGAIVAYDMVLRLEPPFAPGQGAALSAKRGVQELVLLSHRRGLEDTISLRDEFVRKKQDTESRLAQQLLPPLRRAGRTSTDRVRRIGLRDVEQLRRLVDADLDTTTRKVEGDSPLYRGPLAALRPRALADLEKLRKVARSDINQLELRILRGDPTLTFVRDVLRKAGLLPATATPSFKPRARTGAGAAIDGDGDGDGKLWSADASSADAGFWIREQFERGALPRDPALISALLVQARRNPELVTRLATEAKERYDRAKRDAAAAAV